MMENVLVKLYHVLLCQNCIQQEDGSFCWHSGLGDEEDASEVLHLERSFMWC